MEGNESGLTSYYHHHHQHHNRTNGLFSNHPQQQQQQQQHHHHNNSASSGHYSSSEATTALVFPPHSVTSRAPLAASAPPETVRRKRGRPRKYGASPEALPASASASSAKRVSASPSSSLPLSSSSPHKKEHNLLSSPKKARMLALGLTQCPRLLLYAGFEKLDVGLTPPILLERLLSSFQSETYRFLGNAGQGFMPHVITVATGEDVAQKIMSFIQQRRCAVCIISASGSISNASLRQPASLGGNVTYEGRFEIVSLSGSFLHTDIGGALSRTGGLSVCLSGSDGHIVGGGVGGPLKAAGPVQVIAGSFVIDTKKEVTADPKFETSGGKVPHVIGATVSSVSFQSAAPDSSGTPVSRGNDDQSISGNNFILQPRGMHVMNEWRSGLDSTSAFPGRTDHRGCPSPEDGDDEHLLQD